MNNNKFNSKFFSEYFQNILQILFDNIGKKNLLSVIVTGSIARNQESYRKLNEQLFLESDIDLVIVVKRIAVLKSLIQNKRLSEILTKKFRKKQLLSHVSLSISTEKSLFQSNPSIFYLDLILNGKIIYGKNILKILPHYEVNEIPKSDISKLLFNRMAECMESVIPIIYLKKNPKQNEYSLTVSSIRKFIFTMIQALLIKENILLFNFSELIELKNQKLDYLTSIITNDLLLIFDEINKILEFQKNISKETIENFWIKTTDLFDETFLRIFNTEKISSQLILSTMSDNNGFFQRVRISILLLLQYLKIKKNSEVFQIILYSFSHNPYHVYTKLYKSFKSSSIGIANMINSSRIENQKNESMIFSIKYFQKYLNIWKLIYS